MEEEITQVDRARLFWSTQDPDSVFSQIQNQLDLLQTRLKTNSASDKELLQSLKLLEALDWPPLTPPPVVQVVIGSDALSPTAPPAAVVPAAVAPGSAPEGPQPPRAPAPYQDHCCSQSCVPTLPSMPQSLLWAQNPLKVPLIYGFYRSKPETDQSEQEGGVVYTAPCGLRLCNYDDVMDFLLMTETFHFLQCDLFSFSASVCVASDPLPSGPAPSPAPGPDLSRDQELTPVELCVGDGQRPPVFRYRRERWPRGCFLSSAPELFQEYCYCRGGCGAGPGAEGACPCVSMTTGGRYKHGRLREPNKNGIFECGPWCGCDPGLCQNRVVQRGLRVRLQVYRTDQDQDQDQDQSPDRGWGVRCKDDLEQGTFVCVYAGVVLQRGEGQDEAPPPKQRRAELPTDDEVQLVTEWLPSATPDSTHVAVIQRGSEVTDQVQPLLLGRPSPELPGSEPDPVNGTKRTQTPTSGTEDFYLLDASKEGNVSRFFNHSCEPTLFLQNVFTDSHDSRFPNIAFFTNRDLEAGTELTWDYSSTPSQEVNGGGQEVEEGNQEVPCLCRSAKCRERFFVTELKKPGASEI